MYNPYDSGRTKIQFGGPLTLAVKVLLIANISVYLLTAISETLGSKGDQVVGLLFSFLGMTPSVFWGQFTLWMPVTYLFIHSGFWHIALNMFVLWMFGGEVEQVFGTRKFVMYYLFCGVGAGLLVAVLQYDMIIPTVGASGAIYGVMLAYGLFFPNRIIYFSLVIPIKAKWFVVIIGAMVFLSSMSASGGGISHIAHLGGFIFGYIYIKRRKIFSALKGLGKKRRRGLHVVDLDKARELFEDEDDDDYRIH